ncbi:condensation domain-containing protein [Williamsia herbipolensis]|uniref:Condensation domain-containing protein n=1 Tax=Williamsia herbipolensis TaxID=1603258 RepID=A0AAU4K2F4_9NOCA|nr:condensation domain-containing protein [Williamsia herbipolensis]
MRVTTIDRFAPAPGTVVQWAVDASASTGVASAIPPSFNQSHHLASAAADPAGESTWLAASFDVDGPVDLKAIERAFLALIARHGTLHSGFVRDGGRVVRHLHDPAALRVIVTPPRTLTTVSAVRDALRGGLRHACTPFGGPGCHLATIDRADRSTILCGFDHAHVDAYSMAIVVDDLARLYGGYRAEPGAFDPRVLPPAASFVDYCAEEAGDDRDFSRHPGMDRWVEFFARHDRRPPEFPLDLGLAPGARARQAVDVRTLLGPRDTATFAASCAESGSSVYAGILSAMAHAVHDLGGGSEMPVLFPMHTRRSRRWENAMGWFTTNAPVTITVETDLPATIARAGPAVREAVALGEIPIPRVLETIGGLRAGRTDIFMVSYVDYRRLPGAHAHDLLDAHHISNVTSADDAQFWISRTESGLALRTRYPDTAVARATMDAFLGGVGRHAAAETLRQSTANRAT